MANYSIKDLEKLSGIKAHTIRIWEKRYNLINPKRTPSNVRYYSDEDLKKLINIAIVNNSGVKISHIARLPASELIRIVDEQSKSRNSPASPIEQLVIATVEMNERSFNKTFAALRSAMPFESIVSDVLYPFLERIGVLWQTGEITPAQEHFVSNLIRQKIFTEIDSLPLPQDEATRVVLFLPENEYHEMGLLFHHYIARKTGYNSIYLGQSVPWPDLLRVIEIHQPALLITALVTNLSGNDLDNFFHMVSTHFRDQKVLFSGRAAQQGIAGPANALRFSSTLELKQLLLSHLPANQSL